ncbi:hypothetical protein QR680_000494 [Steinernema hermaphroditum]|uniref:Uncharacterized protein n=1 Tax=Steinernema hermaphroditum TaxID=289476 RepID=A0AA39GUZ6_9BILA|nr:hypothetical protein QR680_000494 [Steinernema hermaphroditum]
MSSAYEPKYDVFRRKKTCDTMEISRLSTTVCTMQSVHFSMQYCDAHDSAEAYTRTYQLCCEKARCTLHDLAFELCSLCTDDFDGLMTNLRGS